jgi:hypothetical protein
VPAHFGTDTVNEAGKTSTHRTAAELKRSSFPNQVMK